MPETAQSSITPSSTTIPVSKPAKRRSTRIPARSEEAASPWDIVSIMGDKESEKNLGKTSSLGGSPASLEGWKHPAELQYIRRADWSQDLMITYLCQKAFTVPPRQLNTTLSYTEITRSYSGEKIYVPRGYRIPLMFVAKFQWESLRLVLNSASEWEEYKFDIVHLSRLCTHFFKQAKSASSEKKLTKAWRSPMFDRALIRFYRKWMVSREWSVKKFWEEFEEDEYKLDVLKFDWSRWVLRGHKGFVLTKEEVQNGVTADQFREGLRRRPDGTWMWGGEDTGAKDTTSLDALTCLASQDAVEAITDATPSHDSIEVKQELLETQNGDIFLNNNGKRRRGDEGGPPRKRRSKKSRPRPKISPLKKAAANPSVPLIKSVSPDSSGDEWAPGGGRWTGTSKGIPKEYLMRIPPERARRSGFGAETVEQARRIAREREAWQASISKKPPLNPISTDSPTEGPKLAHLMKDLTPISSTQLQDTSSTVLPVKNGDSGIFKKLDMLNPSLKSIPTVPLIKSVSRDSSPEWSVPSWSSSNWSAEEDTAMDKQAPSQPISLTNNPSLKFLPIPERKVGGNVEVEDLQQAKPMARATISTDLFCQKLPPNPIPTDSLSPKLTHLMKDLTPISSTQLQDISSTVLPVENGDSGIFHSEAGSSSLVSGNSNVSNDVQSNPIPIDPSTRTDPETVPITEVSDSAIMNDRNVDALLLTQSINLLSSPITDQLPSSTIITPLIPTPPPSLSLAEVNLPKAPMSDSTTFIITPNPSISTSEPLQGVVEGAKGNGMNDMECARDVEGIKEMPSEKDIIDEPEVIDTMWDSVHDTNRTGLKIAFGTKQVQETPTADGKDEVDVPMVKVPLELHTQSRQETHMNDTDEMDIASGAVECQSVNFEGTLTTPMDDPTAVHASALESIPSHRKLERGDSREVQITGTSHSEDKMNIDEEILQPIQAELPLPTNGTSPTNRLCNKIIQALDSRSCTELDEPFKELGAHPDTAFDPCTASTSTETISQGVQTSFPFDVNRQFESVEVQTEIEKAVPQLPLCADATMVDLAIPLQEPSSTPAATPEPENNLSVTRTVMSLMRNMADLLECATQGASHGSAKGLKGKGKEVVDDVDMMPSYLDSAAFTTILQEFKSTKEEIRRSQHISQSKLESMRLSHFMEVEALKDEIRNIESRGKQELEEVTRQYSQQIGELESTIRLRQGRERARDREKESGSEKLPSVELLDIRRRVASLEARNRSDSVSADMLRSASRVSMANGLRHPNFNPPHLLPPDLEEHPYATTFRAPRQYMREASISKPGTPTPSDRNPFSNRYPDAMDLDESIPLPAKSQRKMHMMTFPRQPTG